MMQTDKCVHKASTGTGYPLLLQAVILHPRHTAQVHLESKIFGLVYAPTTYTTEQPLPAD